MSKAIIKIHISKSCKSMGEFFASRNNANVFKGYDRYIDNWTGETYHDEEIEVDFIVGVGIVDIFGEYEGFYYYKNEVCFSLDARNKKEADKILATVKKTIEAMEEKK